MRARRQLGMAVPGFAAVALLLGGSGGARAGIIFGFEGQAATSNNVNHPGSLTSLSQTASGFTVTLTRPGSVFDIVDTTTFPGGSFPASWGTRSLDPFAAATSNTPVVVNFSGPVTSFSVDYGDFGGDSDTFSLQAFSGPNGTGTLLASASDVYGTLSLPVFHTVSVSAANIESVVMIGGSPAFPDSVYYDNLNVTPLIASVPEPSTLALLALGAGALTGWRRWRKRRQAV